MAKDEKGPKLSRKSFRVVKTIEDFDFKLYPRSSRSLSASWPWAAVEADY
jgi:hypothetical protein